MALKPFCDVCGGALEDRTDYGQESLREAVIIHGSYRMDVIVTVRYDPNPQNGPPPAQNLCYDCVKKAAGLALGMPEEAPSGQAG